LAPCPSRDGDSATEVLATRHSFISASLEAGYQIKRLADYCGTSVEMIERHYAGYLRDETPDEILRLGGQPSAPKSAAQHPSAAPSPGVKTGTLPGTFRRARRSTQQSSDTEVSRRPNQTLEAPMRTAFAVRLFRPALACR
jgi:hypothetical protein